MLFARRQDFKDMGLSVTSIRLWESLIFVIWIPKFFLGQISEVIGCWGFHRKPYILWHYGMAGVLCLLLGLDRGTVGSYISIFFFMQIGICWGDVIIDSLMVAEMRGESDDGKGAIVGLTNIIRSIGYIVGGLFSGVIFDLAGPRVVYLVEGCVFCIQVGVCLFLYKETPRRYTVVQPNGEWDTQEGAIHGEELEEGGEDPPSSPVALEPPKSAWSLTCNAMNRTLRHPVYWRLLVFNLITGLIPSSGLGFYYFLTQELDFSATQFAIIGTVGYIVRTLFIVVYNSFLRKSKLSTVYLAVQVIDIFVSFIPLAVVSGYYKKVGLPAYIFVLSDDVLDEALDLLRSLPLQITAGILCEKNVEAAVYQISHSVLNLAWLVHGFIDAPLLQAFGINHDNFTGLSSMIILCGALEATIPLIAAPFLLPRITIPQISEITNQRKQEEEGGSITEEADNPGQ